MSSLSLIEQANNFFFIFIIDKILVEVIIFFIDKLNVNLSVVNFYEWN